MKKLSKEQLSAMVSGGAKVVAADKPAKLPSKAEKRPSNVTPIIKPTLEDSLAQIVKEQAEIAKSGLAASADAVVRIDESIKQSQKAIETLIQAVEANSHKHVVVNREKTGDRLIESFNVMPLKSIKK